MLYKAKPEKYSDLGKLISDELDRRGATRMSLAREVGISFPYLTDIMQGHRPNSPQIPKILKFLNIKK